MQFEFVILLCTRLEFYQSHGQDSLSSELTFLLVYYNQEE